jgi:hypothetical protein
VNDLLSVVLALVLMVFSGTLAGLAVATSQRFGERRYLLVAAGFSAITLVAALAAVSEYYNLLGEAFDVESTPLLLLVIATACLYFAMFRARSPPERPEHG